jgi:hypothetical protein
MYPLYLYRGKAGGTQLGIIDCGTDSEYRSKNQAKTSGAESCFVVCLRRCVSRTPCSAASPSAGAMKVIPSTASPTNAFRWMKKVAFLGF